MRLLPRQLVSAVSGGSVEVLQDVAAKQDVATEKVYEHINAAKKELSEFRISAELEKTLIRKNLDAFIEHTAKTHIAVSNGLAKEVADLEARKQDMLKPVAELKATLEAKQAEMDTLKVQYDYRERYLQEQARSVQEQLKKIQYVQHGIDKETDDLDYKLLELRAQETAVKEMAANIQSNWTSFLQTVSQSAYKLRTWEADIQANRKAIAVLYESIQQQQQQLAQDRTTLVDLQASIKAAFDEARSKHLL